MANPGCVDGTINGVENYSSPVPIIGLYIVASSLICLLLMVYDVVVAGILAKKSWLPCMYFKLDSVTLTLLGVGAKITVDLTTPMPSNWDQLAKLTGTAFICICMVFLVPSIGLNAESECFTNMMALSIFVVTVTVNICIQLYTGVIVLFFKEHIVILCCMWLLLVMLWHISFSIMPEKRIDAGTYTSFLTKGSNGLLDRLKISCFGAQCCNPQFKISMYPMNIAISTVCVVCTSITIQASLRSLIQNNMEFCQRVSNYRWSMRYIVITQVLIVILGPIPSVVRSIALFNRMNFMAIIEPFKGKDDAEKQLNQALRTKGITLHMHTIPNVVRQLYQALRARGITLHMRTIPNVVRQLYQALRTLLMHTIPNVVRYMITRIALAAQLLIVFPSWIVGNYLRLTINDNPLHRDDEYSDSGYRIRKSVEEMIKMKDEASRSKVLYQPSQFLCKKHPSCYCNFTSRYIVYNTDLLIKVHTLSMVLLVKIAEASIPKDLLVPLLNAFHGAKEVIHYIDEAIPPRTSRKIHKLRYARALWVGGDLTCFLSNHKEPGLDHKDAVETIQNLHNIPHTGDIWRELHAVTDIILRSNHSTVAELYTCIEAFFADMLHILYAQLPEAIFRALSKAPAEEFGNCAEVALKLLLRIGSLECQNKWKFPSGMSGIVSNGDEEYKRAFRGLKQVVLVRVCPDSDITEVRPVLV